MARPAFTIEGTAYRPGSARAAGFTVRSVPRPYPVVLVGEGMPGAAAQAALDAHPENLMLVDRRVAALYADNFRPPGGRVLKVPATERSKTLAGALRVIDFLDRHCFTKSGTLVVAGGGILQDLGAFAAACYKRGIPWCYFPTTLLAMADSCIGGKSGLNHRGGKNQLALFSAPARVLVHTGFLRTLPFRALRSGLGEILKLHITAGPDHLEAYERRVRGGKVADFRDYGRLIGASLQIKRAVVEKDEFERDHRRALNYGHTFGHALESLTGFRIPHGQAVAAGMIVANALARKAGRMGARDEEHIRSLALDLLSPAERRLLRDLPSSHILSLLRRDKKTCGDSVTLVLVEAPGRMRFVPCPIGPRLGREVGALLKRLF